MTFPKIPISVTINEYVEIAKNYSTPRSGSYVNGLLDAIARRLIEEGKVKKSLPDPVAKDDAEEDPKP
jgi:N utilization substance protein B